MTGKETPEMDGAAKAVSRAPKAPAKPDARPETTPEEIGGRNGPEPTRYGDWEVKGICSDF